MLADFDSVDVPVAQLDRAPGYGPGGREFESSRAHTLKRPVFAYYGRYGAFFVVYGGHDLELGTVNATKSFIPIRLVVNLFAKCQDG